jgi:hypothetical protein
MIDWNHIIITIAIIIIIIIILIITIIIAIIIIIICAGIEVGFSHAQELAQAVDNINSEG